jgi:DNA repair photolyase
VDSKETLRFLEEIAERLRYIAVEIGVPDLLKIAKEIEREASNLEDRIKSDEL